MSAKGVPKSEEVATGVFADDSLRRRVGDSRSVLPRPTTECLAGTEWTAETFLLSLQSGFQRRDHRQPLRLNSGNRFSGAAEETANVNGDMGIVQGVEVVLARPR